MVHTGRQSGWGGKVLGEGLGFVREQVSRLDSVPPGHVISDKYQIPNLPFFPNINFSFSVGDPSSGRKKKKIISFGAPEQILFQAKDGFQ